MGFSLHFSVSSAETRHVAVKSGVVIFSPWFGQVGCRCGHHFLLTVSFFFCFRGRKEVSLSETPAKLENILCLCLLNLQGECYCSKALGTKDRGTHPTAP